MLILDSGLNQQAVCSRFQILVLAAIDSLRHSLDFCAILIRGIHRLYLTIRPQSPPTLPETEQSSHPPMADQYPTILHYKCLEQPCIQLQYFSAHTHYPSIRWKHYDPCGRIYMGKEILQATSFCRYLANNWCGHCGVVGSASKSMAI